MILRRIPGSRFSEILREWVGCTVAILGGGPSLTSDDVRGVQRACIPTIAVNDAYLLAPWADLSYFADSRWWRWHHDGVACPTLGLTADQVRERFARFPGEKCSIQHSGSGILDEAVHILRNKHYPDHGNGLSLDPQALATGRNSGFQALNLAILAGAQRVLLLGFDGAPDKAGRRHWFGDHPRVESIEVFPYYRQAMSAAESAISELGVSVINCSPTSRIDSFKKLALEEALSC